MLTGTYQRHRPDSSGGQISAGGNLRGQVKRLQGVFKILGKPARAKTCDAIMGITKEGAEIMTDYKGMPALDAGLLLNSPQADALRFMPALNVTRAEVLEMIEGLDAILTKAGAARRVA